VATESREQKLKQGRRPGAGRKSDKTIEYQAGMRQVVEEVVTPEKWREAIEGMLLSIKDGNAKAFTALAPYVMGAAPKEVTIKGDADHPMVFVIE
jgi:hypothetical protein